jgi:hypothetical protein
MLWHLDIDGLSCPIFETVLLDSLLGLLVLGLTEWSVEIAGLMEEVAQLEPVWAG